MPASHDLVLWRGNNDPIAFVMKDSEGELSDPTGLRFILTAFVGGREKIAKDSDEDADFVVDLPTSTLTWTPTLDDARSLPLGRIAKYELEEWDGDTQETLMEGRILVKGGNNRDE